MKGIDVYSGQGNVDFNAVKASGIEIVYIKATEGLTYNDKTLKEFYDGAKAAGLKVGFYHFMRRNDPYEEAEHFISKVEGLQVDCKYMLDVEAEEFENTGKNDTSTRIRQFYDYMQSKGYETGIYTYSSFYKDLFDDRVKNLPLWIAEYGVNKPNISVPYIGFQYSETGHINGIQGECDLDEFSDGILLGNANVLKASIQTEQISQDNTVKIIQQQLNTLLKKGLVVDGIRGNATDSAIKEFQKTMGLVADGIWGAKTVEAVTEIFSKPLDWINAPHYEYATRYIQWRVGSGGDKAGYFSKGTANYVSQWQRNHGLNADGKCGTNTWSKMLDQNC